MGLKKNALTENQLSRLHELLGELDGNQKIWLSGYLEGMLMAGVESVISAGKEVAANKKSIANLTILYATETGNCQELAEKMAGKAAYKNIDAKVFSLYDYDIGNLAKEENVAVIVSTHGEGEMVEMAEEFYAYISEENAERLDEVSFSVLALGDKTYKYFCSAGEQIYSAMRNLGAYNIVSLEKCDVDYEQKADIWMNNFMMNVSPAVEGSLVETIDDVVPGEYSKTQPFDARVINKKKLSGDGSDKEVFHLELSLEGSGLNYEPGDAVGVLTVNPQNLVEQIIETAGFDREQQVFVKEGQVSLFEAMQNHVEITVLTFDLISKYYAATKIEDLGRLLENDELLAEYIYQRDLLDLLEDYSFKWNANKLIEILRPLPPRLYSISSSMEKVGQQVHATISLLRYGKGNRERMGACSSQVVNNIEVGDAVPIYIDKNPSFKLPEDNSAIIMVGAGTGVAPYRGFMQQRKSEGYTGYSWLFYGDRRFDSDFLYKNEWEELLEDESLERLELAFSRDQEEKVYVQHKLIENQEEVFEWIENGAHIYLCGDMKHMAKDVNKTLLEIIQSQGGIDEEHAKKYLKMLKREKRFQMDVY